MVIQKMYGAIKKTISVEPKVIFLFFMKEIELYYPDSQSTK